MTALTTQRYAYPKPKTTEYGPTARGSVAEGATAERTGTSGALGDPHWLPPVIERPGDDPPIGWSTPPGRHAFSPSPRPETRTCVRCGRFPDHAIHGVEAPASPRWDRR